MTDDMETEDERPELTHFQVAPERWKPEPEVEDQILETVKDILPLKLRPSDRDLEKFYDLAYQLYKSGQYKSALPYFKMLNVIHPKHPKYVMAAAACCQMLKDYEPAIALYSIAAILDPQNPMPQYYIAGCSIKLKETFGALIALEMGVLRCTTPQYQAIKDRMEMMMTNLHRELEEKKAAGLPLFNFPNTELKS